ncbi:hypothetical protein MBLNU230_g4737t1 [Neophaeotheca triangularis]
MAFVKQRDLFHFAVKYEIWDPNMSSIGAITCQPDPFEGEEGVDAQINEAKFDISWIRSQSKNIDRFVSVVQRLFNESCSDTRKPPLQIRVFADGNTDRDKLFLHMLRSRLASAIPIWWNVPFQKRKLLNIHGALTAQFISAVEAESLALENNGGRAFWRDAMDEVFRHQDKSSVLPEPIEQHFTDEIYFGRAYLLSDGEWLALRQEVNDKRREQPPDEWTELDREYDRFEHIRAWATDIEPADITSGEEDRALHELEVQRDRTMAAQEILHAALENQQFAEQIRGTGAVELEAQQDRVSTAREALQAALVAERFLARKSTKPRPDRDTNIDRQATNLFEGDASFRDQAPNVRSSKLALLPPCVVPESCAYRHPPEQLPPLPRDLNENLEKLCHNTATRIVKQAKKEVRQLRLAKRWTRENPSPLEQQKRRENAIVVDAQIERGNMARREAATAEANPQYPPLKIKSLADMLVEAVDADPELPEVFARLNITDELARLNIARTRAERRVDMEVIERSQAERRELNEDGESKKSVLSATDGDASPCWFRAIKDWL